VPLWLFAAFDGQTTEAAIEQLGPSLMAAQRETELSVRYRQPGVLGTVALYQDVCAPVRIPS
jgi:hypothetical protein